MEDMLRQLAARKSVRVFEDTPVPPEAEAAILEAAFQAPTAGNQQLYTILNIKKPEIKQKLSKTCDNQPFIAGAPLMLVFLADCRRWHDAYLAAGLYPRPPGVGDLVLACCDALIAAQNTVVAAHALGLGSCYIGDILEQKEAHTRLLGLEPWVLPVAMVVYGRPTRQQRQRPKPRRFEPAGLVMTDRYRRQGPDELRELFGRREGAAGSFDYDGWMDAFCSRKYMSDFSTEMTRSVAEYIRQYVPFVPDEAGGPA